MPPFALHHLRAASQPLPLHLMQFPHCVPWNLLWVLSAKSCWVCGACPTPASCMEKPAPLSCFSGLRLRLSSSYQQCGLLAQTSTKLALDPLHLLEASICLPAPSCLGHPCSRAGPAPSSFPSHSCTNIFHLVRKLLVQKIWLILSSLSGGAEVNGENLGLAKLLAQLQVSTEHSTAPERAECCG